MNDNQRTSTRTDAQNLVDWLSLPGASERYPGASIIASYLRMLLTSATPDADELLEDEIKAIESIVVGAG